MPSTAFNYLETSLDSGNTSFLQKKVSIFLGLRYPSTRSLTSAFVERGLELISDDLTDKDSQGQDAAETGDVEAGNNRTLQEVPMLETPGGDESSLFGEIEFLRENSLSVSALRDGVFLDRYRVEDLGKGHGFRLLFRPDQYKSWQELASFDTPAEAVTAANALRRLLVRLNVETEGFHLVEHILLRPLQPERLPQDLTVPEDFYSFTISVFFSGWTARFHDEMFRRLAEETVQLNCPAHVYPEFHWLDFHNMQEFENLYRHWLEARSSSTPDPVEIDSASAGLIEFIIQRRAEDSERHGRR